MCGDILCGKTLRGDTLRGGKEKGGRKRKTFYSFLDASKTPAGLPRASFFLCRHLCRGNILGGILCGGKKGETFYCFQKRMAPGSCVGDAPLGSLFSHTDSTHAAPNVLQAHVAHALSNCEKGVLQSAPQHPRDGRGRASASVAERKRGWRSCGERC